MIVKTGLPKGANRLVSRAFQKHTSPRSFGAPTVGVAARHFKGDGGKTEGGNHAYYHHEATS
jgi:hypothetical protein